MDTFAVNPVVRGVMLGLFRTALGNSKRLQLVAASDIGWFAARALEDPERYAGREIPLAGDELSVPEFVSTFKQVTGRGQWVAPIPKFLPKLAMPKEYSTMFTWIGEQGFKADIGALRQEHPRMMTFAAWLRASDVRS